MTHCYISTTGTNAAMNITTTANLSYLTVNSANSPTFTGAGTIGYDIITNLNAVGTITITTLTLLRFACSSLAINGLTEITSGTGNPNTVVPAQQGSLWLRTDGSSSSTRAYINTNGSTGWTNIVTAS
jgi:hypothetical protein